MISRPAAENYFSTQSTVRGTIWEGFSVLSVRANSHWLVQKLCQGFCPDFSFLLKLCLSKAGQYSRLCRPVFAGATDNSPIKEGSCKRSQCAYT
jgi:hypothetical protein